MQSSLWTRVLLLILALTASAANADPIIFNFGTVTYDLSNPTGSTAGSTQFDITNSTGTLNNFPPDFPIDTPMTISNLLLTVTFADGSNAVYPVDQLFLSTDAITSATLTGTFDQTTIMVSGMAGSVTILSSFTATIFPSDPTVSPFLTAGQDLAIVSASVAPTSPVPEPPISALLFIGITTMGIGFHYCQRSASALR